MIAHKDSLTLSRRSVLLGSTTLGAAAALAQVNPAARAETSSLNPQPLPPSPEWTRALPPGPDTRVKITEECAKHIARDTYFWAWPLVSIFNRRQAFSRT
jgi:hypothetical protein